MRSFVLPLLGAVALSGYAGCKDPCEVKCCQPVLRNALPLYETLDVCGTDFGARADVLYMVYQVPVLTYASLQTTTSQIVHSNILSVPGDMSVGCNVALLYTMPGEPRYSFESSWYHIVAEFSRSVTAPDLIPAHSVALTVAAQGTGTVDAQVAINLFDLMIKKDFAFGNWFALTPAAGLVGGYMNGKNTAHFNATSGAFSAASGGNTASTIADVSYTTKFEGIGLKIGGSSSFKIAGGFRLKADLYYNALYGYAKAALDYSQNGLSLGGTARGTVVNYSQHHGRSFFDSLLGLAWEHRFRNDSLYLDLHAGWRFQTFSDGWKEFEAEFNDSLHELALSGQGLQAGATFKF